MAESISRFRVMDAVSGEWLPNFQVFWMPSSGLASEYRDAMGRQGVAQLRGIKELGAGKIWIQADGYRHAHLGPEELRVESEFTVPMTPGWPCSVSVTAAEVDGLQSFPLIPGIEVWCDGEYVATTDERCIVLFSLDAAPSRITLKGESLAGWKVVERMGVMESGDLEESSQRSTPVHFVLERQ